MLDFARVGAAVFDLQGFGIFAFWLAVVVGTFLRGVVLSPNTQIPAHPCGAPPPVEFPAPPIDDWVGDPAHPIVAMFYPPIATRHRQEGATMLSICIMPDGWVGDAVIKKSSGHTQLDAITLVSAGNWHFGPAPGGINGTPEWADVSLIYKMPAVPQAALPPALPPAPMMSAATVDTGLVGDPAFPRRVGYPVLGLRHDEEGPVTLAVDIEDDGWPSDAQVVKSSGSAQLDDMAVVGIGYWHYFPATKSGNRVRGRHYVRVNFRLN
jgi:TonB family protein